MHLLDLGIDLVGDRQAFLERIELEHDRLLLHRSQRRDLPSHDDIKDPGLHGSFLRVLPPSPAAFMSVWFLEGSGPLSAAASGHAFAALACSWALPHTTVAVASAAMPS